MTHRRAAAVVALTLLATACPSSPPAPAPSPPVRAGGSITVAMPWEAPTLDPATDAGRSLPTRDVLDLLMPRLFGGDDALAERRATTVSADAITIRLRPDAMWSDGRPIGTADLRRTWRHLRHRRSAPEVVRRITRIDDAVDGGIRIGFDGAPDGWEGLFSGEWGVLPARTLRTGWPRSGGPFVLARWRRGLDMRFERNERWWGDAASLAAIRIVFVPDATSALTLFERDRIDAMLAYHAPDLIRRLDEAGARVAAVRGHAAYRLVLARRGPLSSPVVRRAVLTSVDLGRVERGLVQDEGDPAGEPPAFDLAGTRAALAADGWIGSPVRTRGDAELTFSLAVPNADELGFVIAGAIKFQTQRAGFRIELVGLDEERFWGEWLSGPDLEAALVPARDQDVRGRAIVEPALVFASAEGVVLAPAPRPFGNVERWGLAGARA